MHKYKSARHVTLAFAPEEAPSSYYPSPSSSCVGRRAVMVLTSYYFLLPDVLPPSKLPASYDTAFP
jgi:hypothetical protein